MTAQVKEILETESGKMYLNRCPDIPDWSSPLMTALPIRPLSATRRALFRSTGCYRMYRGTWRIRNGGFYLVSVECGAGLLGGKPILATWYSGSFIAREGPYCDMTLTLPSVDDRLRRLEVEVREGRVVSMVERRMQDDQLIVRRLRRRETPGRRERIILTLARAVKRGYLATFARGRAG